MPRPSPPAATLDGHRAALARGVDFRVRDKRHARRRAIALQGGRRGGPGARVEHPRLDRQSEPFDHAREVVEHADGERQLDDVRVAVVAAQLTESSSRIP